MKNKSGVSLITLIITIIVVIILAVIVLRSGASDAPDQAAFSGFTQEMGELQDAVKVAMLEAKSSEILKGNQRTEAQLYNFVARGGYEVVDSGDKWLLQSDAEMIPCTLINDLKAQDVIGMKLPEIKVETAKGVGEKVSYFVTQKGTVFCWPPYVYDGKSYVNASTTIKDNEGNEMGETLATESGEREIVFVNDVSVKVKNCIGMSVYGYENSVYRENMDGDVKLVVGDLLQNHKVCEELDLSKYSVWYGNSAKGGEVLGLDFEEYKNDTTYGASWEMPL